MRKQKGAGFVQIGGEFCIDRGPEMYSIGCRNCIVKGQFLYR